MLLCSNEGESAAGTDPEARSAKYDGANCWHWKLSYPSLLCIYLEVKRKAAIGLISSVHDRKGVQSYFHLEKKRMVNKKPRVSGDCRLNFSPMELSERRIEFSGVPWRCDCLTDLSDKRRPCFRRRNLQLY